MAIPEGAPLLSDPYQDPVADAGAEAAARALDTSPASDREDAAPVSKMSRRWQLSARQASPAALLPMEDSPGSSGATSSWQVIAPPQVPSFEVDSESDGDVLCPLSLGFADNSDMLASPSRPLLQPTPKPRAWKRPPVCLRFNSPFQVDKPGPKPLARPSGACPQFRLQARWVPQSPQQHERVSWGSDARPMPHFDSAHQYAKYPSQISPCPIDSSLQCPTPAPIPPRVEPPGAPTTKVSTFTAPRSTTALCDHWIRMML